MLRTKEWFKNSCRILALIAFLFGLSGILINGFAQTASKPTPTAALLDIKGAIGPAVQDYISRGIKQAQEQGARVIILQMDTPGGLSKSMRMIIKDILSSPIPVISFVAPSGARAASAGTYILYASHLAVMAPGTNLGAATPVSIGTPGGQKDKNKKKDKATSSKSASQTKAINDARAYIRSLAQLRKRNVKWAEKAVTKGESLSGSEALKLNVIDFIARDIPAVLQKSNGMKVNVLGQEKILNTKNLVVKKIVPDWRSKFLAVITDPSVAYILLMIGVYGIFFEFANPGFIVPGVVGAICLLLALYAFQLLPINYAGLGLIVLGLAFIIAEAFVPSVGALGLGGIIAFIVGSIMLIRTDIAGYGVPWSIIFGVTAVTVLFFVIVLQLAFRSRRKPVVSGREAMLGKEAVVIERGGNLWVRIEGESWLIANSDDLQEGQKVIVKEMQGLQLRVERQG